MKKFIVRRLLQSLLLLWFVMSLSFLLVHTVKGGPEQLLLSNPLATQADLARMRHNLGLDEPLYLQYWHWLINCLTFNFGTSFKQNVPVLDVIGERFWPTVQLGLVAYLIGLFGIPMGIYAARHRGKFGDGLIRVVTVMGSAMPSWWLALILIVILSNTVGWFPQGQGEGVGGLLNLIIPAALLATVPIIQFSRYVRSETLEVLSQDYVRTATSKGLPPNAINRRHVLPNVLIPVVTLLGGFLSSIFSGAIIIEVLFSWPGMGRLFFESAYARDYPVVLTIVLISTTLTIAGTFLADIAYGLIDPRVKY